MKIKATDVGANGSRKVGGRYSQTSGKDSWLGNVAGQLSLGPHVHGVSIIYDDGSYRLYERDEDPTPSIDVSEIVEGLKEICTSLEGPRED